MAEVQETATAPVADPVVSRLEEDKENQEVNEENQGSPNQGDDAKETSETELKLSELKLDSQPSADIEKVTADLLQSRSDLLGRVQNLKKDLQEWRGKLDTQVKTYRQELGELRTTLNSEVEQLRNEFQSLRTTLKRQLDATTGLTELGPDSSPEKVNESKENSVSVGVISSYDK